MFSIVDGIAFENTLAEGIQLERRLSLATFGLVGWREGGNECVESSV